MKWHHCFWSHKFDNHLPTAVDGYYLPMAGYLGLVARFEELKYNSFYSMNQSFEVIAGIRRRKAVNWVRFWQPLSPVSRKIYLLLCIREPLLLLFLLILFIHSFIANMGNMRERNHNNEHQRKMNNVERLRMKE